MTKIGINRLDDTSMYWMIKEFPWNLLLKSVYKISKMNHLFYDVNLNYMKDGNIKLD